MNLLPINESEAVIDAFWDGDKNADDSVRDVLGAYRIDWRNGTPGTVRPPAHLTLPGAAEVIVSRAGELDVSGYDRLVLGASLPRTVKVTLAARLDGTWETLITRANGTDSHHEYEAPFHCRRLTGLRLTFTQTTAAEAVVSLDWLLLSDHDGVQRMLTRQPEIDPEWPGLMAREPETAEPQLGLFFDRRELEALRRKLERPHLRRHWEALLAKAESLLSIEPETLVGTYAPGGVAHRGCRLRDRDKPWLGAGVADLLAFAGLLSGDARFSRQAVRMAMALAHCQYWTHSFLGALPGTTAHPRCFSESYILRALPLVLDWAGHWLTPAGRELIRDAMVLKGLARVQSDFRRWAYIRRMNQGLLFSPGRILATLALTRVYPRYATDVEEAANDLREMIDAYLLADGGTTEGMGYWHCIGETFAPLLALAREQGRPFRDSLPERLLRTADYAAAMLSTTASEPQFLPINAIGARHRQPALSTAGVFAAIGAPGWGALYATLVTDADPQADWFHLLIAPDEIAAAPIASPRTYCFAESGHAGIHRETAELGTVRLHVFSGPSGNGHSHQDKGSFLIEAAGECLATDRGTVAYEDPAHLLMARAGWHNLATPDDDNGRALEQQPKTTRGGRLLHSRCEDDLWDVLTDNADAWEPGLFRRNRRRFWSPAPTLLVIDDDLELATPHRVSFQLNTPQPPVQVPDGGWQVTGERARLRIIPANWSPDQATAESAGIDWQHRDVHLLRLSVPAASRHRLVTVLEIVPAHSAPRWAVRWQDADQMLVLTQATIQFRYSLQGDLACACSTT